MELTANQIIGLFLWAAKEVKAHRQPDEKSEVVQTIQAGQSVGKVYSYVERSGQVWWMFEFTDGGFYYVKHEPGKFDVQRLEDQLPAVPQNPPFAINDGLTVAAILFTGYQSSTAKTTGAKWGWGAAAALITGNFIVKKFRNIDLTPF